MGKRQRSEEEGVEKRVVKPRGQDKVVRSHAQRRIEREAREAERKAATEKKKREKEAKEKEAYDAFQKRMENYRFCRDVLQLEISEPKLGDTKPKRVRPTVGTFCYCKTLV